ncbi:MAG TPA: hypothetical protein VE955_06730 [Candidatus Dormibacteraeota bacterium]|nr:hypothetical protein [Candidatus Dormibacteraeota bacterium]
MTQNEGLREKSRRTIRQILNDPIAARLLARSNVTSIQFETLLLDQLGHDMANKRLTREEMAQIVRDKGRISRGAMNRTLRQARENVSEAIHTVLLLGYGGLFESPSLAPFVEASDRLRSQTEQLREMTEQDPKLLQATLESILESLEEAFEALYGKSRDV